MSAIANWVRKHLKDTMMTRTEMESSQNSQVESNDTKNGNRKSINCPRCKEKIECGNISEHLINCSKSKGQLISKCPFGVKTSSKKPTKCIPGFVP